MPIVWERAFGGIDTQTDERTSDRGSFHNPVGAGFAVAAEHLVGQRMPNIENPGELISSWKQRPSPGGFGPIAGHWLPRLGFAGTYGERWKRERQPLVPDDFDDRFYQCAPLDQQVPGFLRGGELVELRNLTADEIMRFQLPRTVIGFQTRFYSGELVPHRGQMHTLILEPDQRRAIVVWQTSLRAHAKVLKLERTAIFEKTVLE